jgi:hypothetical protein
LAYSGGHWIGENILICLLAVWNVLCSFGIFGNFVVIWYISPRYGLLYQEKPGNPESNAFHFKDYPVNPIFCAQKNGEPKTSIGNSSFVIVL